MEGDIRELFYVEDSFLFTEGAPDGSKPMIWGEPSLDPGRPEWSQELSALLPNIES